MEAASQAGQQAAQAASQAGQQGAGAANQSAQRAARGAEQVGQAAEEKIRATAAARRRAEETNVDLAQVDGTGQDGQITVDDVRRSAQEG
jgi:pyruvate/2-oxoglutarate dehydrogenase complex dihydrolipoamide acyltransferase (E2) component